MPAAARDTLFVSGTDLFALGHYPDNPVYPGALMLDRMQTVACRLVSKVLDAPAVTLAVKRVQYLGVIAPGDSVNIEASMLERDADNAICQVVASVGGCTRVRATVICGPDSRPGSQPRMSDAQTSPPVLGHREIAKILPHRYPFLLLDTIQAYGAGDRIIATKAINRESPLLGRDIPAEYPASLAIESLGQAGVALFFLGQTSSQAPIALVGGMRDVTLHRPIPYDTVLTLDVHIERMMANAVVFRGEVQIGSELAISVGSLIVMVAADGTN